MHLLKQICSHEAFCAQRVHPFHAQLPHLPVPVQVRPGCPLQFPLGSAGFRRMSVVCATAPGVCRALVLTGRWLSGTSTWPRKSSLVCHTESKFTSERQKTININLVTMRQKRKMGEYHYFRNRCFLPCYCCPLFVDPIHWPQHSISCDTPNRFLIPGLMWWCWRFCLGWTTKANSEPPRWFPVDGGQIQGSPPGLTAPHLPVVGAAHPTGRVPAFGSSPGLLPTKARKCWQQDTKGHQWQRGVCCGTWALCSRDIWDSLRQEFSRPNPTIDQGMHFLPDTVCDTRYQPQWFPNNLLPIYNHAMHGIPGSAGCCCTAKFTYFP